MAKIALNKLGLIKENKIVEVSFGENKIEVFQYLDIKSKSMLVNAAVRASVIRGIVDEILADAYLHMFIVENYSNIALTAKQKDNIFETFDLMESNGLIDAIIAAIPQDEYEYLFSTAKKLTINLNEYNKSSVSTTNDLALELQKIVENNSGQTEWKIKPSCLYNKRVLFYIKEWIGDMNGQNKDLERKRFLAFLQIL